MIRPRRAALALFLAPAVAGSSAAAADDFGVTIAPRVPARVAVQDEPFRRSGPVVPDAALDDLNADDLNADELNADEPALPPTERSPSERTRPPMHSPPPFAAAGPAGVTIAPRVARDEYRAAYHAVPFNLAEYRANPGYRHAAAMKFLTGEYPPPAVVPAGGGFGGGPVGPGLGGFGAISPARGFPGLVLPGGFAGPPTAGPPPFAFDPVQGVVPTFVNRYQVPRVFLPRR